MNDSEILITLIAAILLFILLSTGIVAFVFLYYRRVRLHQAHLLENERYQQLNLLNAAIEAQEEERRRIGADIHDDIGPMLATNKLWLSKFLYLEDPGEIKRHVDSMAKQFDIIIEQVRLVAHYLVPQVLLEFGLIDAVDDHCARINETQQLNTTFNYENKVIKLSESEQLALYRIIQEFSNNTIRHANAQKLIITLKDDQFGVHLILHDDGKGITESQFSKSTGIGINNMQARAKSIGAILELSKLNDNGTTITVYLKN